MRKLAGLALALILWASSAAWADMPEAVIDAPATVQAGQPIVANGARAKSDRPLAWKIDGVGAPADLVRDLSYKDGPKLVTRKGALLVIPHAEAGRTYRIAQVVKGVPPGQTELEPDITMHLVVVSAGPAPDPSPLPTPPVPDPSPPVPPKPDPIPGPTPIVTGKLWAFYLADAKAPVSELRKQTDLKEVPAIDAAAASLNLTYRWAQSDTTDTQMATWVGLAKGDKGPGLPCVFFVTSDGTEVGRLKAPDEAAILAEARRLKGVK